MSPRKGAGSKALRPGTPLADNPVPGQTYGKATEQREAMASVPMANGDLTSPPVQNAQNEQATAANLPAPGTLHWDDHPGDMTQPVTHGAPVGAGPGPEALAPIGQTAYSSANVVNELEHLALGPNSSPEVRQLSALARAIGS